MAGLRNLAILWRCKETSFQPAGIHHHGAASIKTVPKSGPCKSGLSEHFLCRKLPAFWSLNQATRYFISLLRNGGPNMQRCLTSCMSDVRERSLELQLSGEAKADLNDRKEREAALRRPLVALTVYSPQNRSLVDYGNGTSSLSDRRIKNLHQRRSGAHFSAWQ